jgi:hypothetical protein
VMRAHKFSVAPAQELAVTAVHAQPVVRTLVDVAVQHIIVTE